MERRFKNGEFFFGKEIGRRHVQHLPQLAECAGVRRVFTTFVLTKREGCTEGSMPARMPGSRFEASASTRAERKRVATTASFVLPRATCSPSCGNIYSVDAIQILGEQDPEAIPTGYHQGHPLAAVHREHLVARASIYKS